MPHHFNSAEELHRLAKIYENTPKFTEETYKKNQVKRGLRDENGAGVITGLTDISDVIAKKMIDGVLTPCDGELYYRGIDVRQMIDNYDEEECSGFEEAMYLLFFNKLPNKKELEEFKNLLSSYRKLPRNFVRDVIMKAPNKDIMNSIARCILMLYSYDNHALDNSSENVLHMLREDSKFTKLEAKVLDIAFILHAEHGGGNNSTFTTHVVTSAGTDTYSTITAALCSLKGPKHGGANIKVMEMFADIKKHVKDWTDKEALREHLSKILAGEAYDGAGLIYGVGHAVYSISDPRAKVFKEYVAELAEAKGRKKEMQLYMDVEELATELICQKRRVIKGVSANVDFYSGFVYNMLGLPVELFTPMFAVSRIAGWSAHRMEELLNNGKIIRPAYVSTNGRNPYIPINERD